jgi:predicted exporter
LCNGSKARIFRLIFWLCCRIYNNDSQAISAAKQLMISLEQQTQQPFTAIRSGADDHLQDLAKVYFEHRFGLLTPEQAHAIETGHWRQLLNAAQS